MGVELQFIRNKDMLKQQLMTCSLCKLILVNPLQCRGCHCHFCFQCLRHYLPDHDSRCPTDGEVVTLEASFEPPAVEIREQLAILEVDCQLCKKPFKLSELERHVEAEYRSLEEQQRPAIPLNYVSERDSPLKRQPSRNAYFTDVKPNIAKLEQVQEAEASSQASQEVLVFTKHDSILDRLKVLREKTKQLASKELIQVLDSSFALNELSFKGVVPADHYIRLPRVQYNLVERNAHLASQENGRVNIRAFRLPNLRDKTESLRRSQFDFSQDRAFTGRNPSLPTKTATQEVPKTLREPFSEYRSYQLENDRLKAIIAEQRDRLGRLENQMRTRDEEVAGLSSLCRDLLKKYQRTNPEDPDIGALNLKLGSLIQSKAAQAQPEDVKLAPTDSAPPKSMSKLRQFFSRRTAQKNVSNA